MVSLIDRTARLDRAVAKHLGERFELRPMITGHMDVSLDSARTGGPFVGHLFLEEEQGDLGGKFDRRVVISGAILKVAFGEMLQIDNIEPNDEIIALERGGIVFKVNSVSKKTGQYVVEMGEF